MASQLHGNGVTHARAITVEIEGLSRRSHVASPSVEPTSRLLNNVGIGKTHGPTLAEETEGHRKRS